MTKADLEKKLEGLRAKEAQALATYQATVGARQFCEHLIAEEMGKQEESSPDNGS